jgi:hypothetical protein
MKKKLIALVLLTGSAAFAETRFSFGVGIDAPVVASRPFYPGPGYTWVDGYYDPYGAWIDGYWAPPVASFGFAPRYDNRFHGGFRRDFDRDGRRDFGRAREFDRGHEGDRGRGAGFGFRR